MNHAKRSSDKPVFLADKHRFQTQKTIRYIGSLLAVLVLCTLGIWFFTPVSEEANYKPDQLADANPLKPTAPQQATAEDSGTIPATVETLSVPAVQDTEPPSRIALTVKASDVKADQPTVTVHAPDALPAAEVPSPPAVLPPSSREEAALSSAIEPRTPEHLDKVRIETITIQSGDSLTRIFSRAGIAISQAIKLSRNPSADQLNRLSIGKTMRLYFDQNDQWEGLEYDSSKLRTLIVNASENGFEIADYEKQVEYRTFTARGVIHSTLGLAAENAGISPGITQNLVDIYQWEIDFARDIQPGDAFSVVYQMAYIDDEAVDDGPILAASFITSGQNIEAIRFTDSAGITGYFQPDGSSLRRGFLRTPVKLARITSSFGKRLHPIKKTWKKHLGVDYGARRGTPVLATADGVIQYAGKKRGYGNTVILRHGGTYSTLYAHMSKFGKGVRSGKNITQGQVIGYVGHTGWATGDHLHYEFRVNGVHKDPQKVKLPKNLPLAKKEMDTFNSLAEPLIGTLTSLRAAQVATLEPTKAQSAL